MVWKHAVNKQQELLQPLGHHRYHISRPDLRAWRHANPLAPSHTLLSEAYLRFICPNIYGRGS